MRSQQVQGNLRDWRPSPAHVGQQSSLWVSHSGRGRCGHTKWSFGQARYKQLSGGRLCMTFSTRYREGSMMLSVGRTTSASVRISLSKALSRTPHILFSSRKRKRICFMVNLAPAQCGCYFVHWFIYANCKKAYCIADSELQRYKRTVNRGQNFLGSCAMGFFQLQW